MLTAKHVFKTLARCLAGRYLLHRDAPVCRFGRTPTSVQTEDASHPEFTAAIGLHRIGNELLNRALQHAQKRGTTNKALITFTFNTVSQGLYVRHGLFPRLPIYFFKVSGEILTGQLRGTPFRCVPVEDSAAHLQRLAQIDARALGISREKHHRYLISDNAMKGFILYAKEDCVGYVYVSVDGHIGPLAVTHPHASGDAFRTALNLAAQSGSPQVSAFLPGVSERTLSIAVEHGMRITIPMVLMSTSAFGNWTQYLPRNPGFM